MDNQIESLLEERWQITVDLERYENKLMDYTHDLLVNRLEMIESKRLERKFVCRKEGDGIRVWRVA